MGSEKDSEPAFEHVSDLDKDSHGKNVLIHAKLYRKIDLHLLPLVFLCYSLGFLDKVVINYANLMGMQQTLQMKGQEFSWLATAFYIAYGLAEFPQGLLLQIYSPAKVLAANIICCGVLLCCTAAVHSFTEILVVRILLGACEAVIAPALMMIISQWYTKRQATPRTGVWVSGLGFGQILGGLIALAGLNSTAEGSMPGWKIMFIAIGVLNIAVACMALLWLPDTVETASFVTELEKKAIQTALVLDQAGTGRKVIHYPSIVEALLDVHSWLLFLLAVLSVLPGGAIGTFSGVMFAGFGYTAKESAALNIPTGAVAIAATLFGTFIVLKNCPRWLGLFSMVIPATIGGGLLSFYQGGKAGLLAGMYLINFDVAAIALVVSLAGVNTQGYTKKIAVNVMVLVGASIGSIIGPQTFQESEAPRYISAKIAIFAANVTILALCILLRLLYGYRNGKTARRREEELAALKEGTLSPARDELKDLTDRTNPSFQYVY